MKHPGVRQWNPGAYDFHFDRTITAINGNRITIDAPIGNAIEREYGGGSIYKYEYPGRIEQVGIENLRGVSEYNNREKDLAGKANLSMKITPGILSYSPRYKMHGRAI